MKTSGVIYTVIFSFLAAFLFVSILAMVNEFTKARVALNQELATRKAVLAACGVSFSSNEEVTRLFNDRMEKKNIGNKTLYILNDPERGTIYAMIFSGKGLWGTITGVLAVNADVSLIEGVDIISQNETPGLGGKIDEPYFKQQFRQEQIKGSIIIGPGGPGDTDHTNSRVDGISGASLTSQLFQIIINNSLTQIKTLVRGLS